MQETRPKTCDHDWLQCGKEFFICQKCSLGRFKNFDV